MEKLRILHVLHSMNRGGAENAIMNYYRHIDKNLLQFDFLLTVQEKSHFEDEIRGLGGRIYKIPQLCITNPIPYLMGLNSFFKEHPEYHIVHSHTSSKSVFPLYYAKKYRIPVRCSHSHNSKTEDGVNGLIRNMLMPFLKVTATDYLSCGNQAAEWLYGKKFFQSGRVLVFKNVIEADKFKYNPFIRKEYRGKLNISDDVLVLGHTARFNTQKNHLFDLEIMSVLKRRGKKVKLLLLGGGDLEHQIIDTAERAKLIDDIIFAGIVPNVYDYEQAMDIFLLPSLFEGLPLSIIEAQVSGLPCITTLGVVSQECSVTNLVSYLRLEDGAEKWADEILKKTKQTRRDRFDEVANAGYDATTSARKLQEFYLRRFEETV